MSLQEESLLSPGVFSTVIASSAPALLIPLLFEYPVGEDYHILYVGQLQHQPH